MVHEKREASSATSLLLSTLAGTALGILMVVWGLGWQSVGTKLEWSDLTVQAGSGAIGGATMGFVLRLTRAFRARGEIQYYAAWMLAGVLGVLMIGLPGLLREGRALIILVLWGGLFAGLVLGALARHIASSEPRT
jgi:hypothetical protein